MKNAIILIALLFMTFYITNAQEISKNTVGIRVGGNEGFGTEVSYQRALNDAHRLELGLGWRDATNFNAYRFTGIYQWIWHLEGNFNWYAGTGGVIGQFDFDNDIAEFDDSSTLFINATANIGIEYNFDFPLLLSVDFRPEIALLNDIDDSFEFDLALGIRYQF